MKRQRNISHSSGEIATDASKKIKEHDDSDVSLNTVRSNVLSVSTENADSQWEDSNNLSIWTERQRLYFTSKYPWIQITDFDSVGCKTCAKLTTLGAHSNKHIHLSAEWRSATVVACGSTKIIMQASMRKKLHEHHTSRAHSKAVEITETREIDTMPAASDGSNLTSTLSVFNFTSTFSVFNTVYSLMKRICPMSGIYDELLLQKKNGLNLPSVLPSQLTAMQIGKHVSQELRKSVFLKIISQESKLCIVVDEVSTLSQKNVLVVFLMCNIRGFKDPVNVFVDLIQLDLTDARSICDALLLVLNEHGFTERYLKQNLISFSSDGASNLLGQKSGVATRILSLFPGIICWHCLSHRVQLALRDAIKSVTPVNYFESFINKIYSLSRTSNAEQTELRRIAPEFAQEILKFGRVFEPSLVAYSAKIAKAVWKAYPVLYCHFSKHNHDGLKKYLESTSFIANLALMIDILIELSLLSLALQSPEITLLKADRLIRRCITALHQMKDNRGKYEKLLPSVLNSETHAIIPFVSNKKHKVLPRDDLIQSVIDNMSCRLLNDEQYSYATQLLNLLEPTTWPKAVHSPWQEGEENLHKLSKMLKYKISVNDFRDLLDERDVRNAEIPQTIKEARKIMKVMAVSFPEVERAFNLINGITTDENNCLLVDNLADLLTVQLIGKPFEQWDATPFVKSWLLQQDQTVANDQIDAKVYSKYSNHQLAIWSLL